MKLQATASQTVGPYFAIGLTWEDGAYVVPLGTTGAFWLRGRVLDGEGAPVSDALVETWQAAPNGHFDHPADPGRAAARGFRGLGRSPTDADGSYAIHTVMPGRVAAGRHGGLQARHIDVSVFARGLLKHVVTRLYLPEELAALASDPVLSGITDPEARRTLIARPDDDGYRFDIRLQGDGETVFFRV